jgi:predicted glycosyltransferase
MTARALLYVQHLLGIGHLARMSRIARGLVAAGMEATIVQGGTDAGFLAMDGVDVVNLTPVKVAANDMATLLHADGRPFDEADRVARRQHLLAVLSAIRPDILLVEAFPFGRRQMRFELLPLLDDAKAMGIPVIASSVRDLLQESRKPGRAEETVELVRRYFDLVLVHGDEALTPLALTFPLARRIVARVKYTGIVGPVGPVAARPGHAVVVSAGGGSVGARLLEAAVSAAPLTRFRADSWLVLAGPNLPHPDFARLQAAAKRVSAKIEVRRSTPDLPACLAGADVSVSQAGYNTVADILVAGCPAVLAPFAAGGETEQSARADALATAGRAVVVRESELSPATVAEAMEQAVRLPKAPPSRLDGAGRTASILLDALARKQASSRRFEGRPALLSSVAGERS